MLTSGQPSVIWTYEVFATEDDLLVSADTGHRPFVADQMPDLATVYLGSQFSHSCGIRSTWHLPAPLPDNFVAALFVSCGPGLLLTLRPLSLPLTGALRVDALLLFISLLLCREAIDNEKRKENLNKIQPPPDPFI